MRTWVLAALLLVVMVTTMGHPCVEDGGLEGRMSEGSNSKEGERESDEDGNCIQKDEECQSGGTPCCASLLCLDTAGLGISACV